MEIIQLGAGRKRISHQFTEDMSITIEQGDDLLFEGSIRVIETLTKRGIDLELDFKSGHKLLIERFFQADKPNIESVLTFDETLYTAEEIASCFGGEAAQTIELSTLLNKHFHSASHELRADGKVHGGSELTALERAPFVYQFTIAEEFPPNAAVSVTVNGKPAPAWLTLKQVEGRRYLLTGTPTHEDAGQMQLQIHVEG